MTVPGGSMEDRTGTNGPDRFLLAGDIGGTKTVLVLYPCPTEVEQPHEGDPLAIERHCASRLRRTLTPYSLSPSYRRLSPGALEP